MEEASEWLGGAGPAPVAVPERQREERFLTAPGGAPDIAALDAE